MRRLKDLEETLKKLIGGDYCPECGCNLWNRKTFYKECFNCSCVIWFKFSSQEKEGVRPDEKVKMMKN